MLQGILIIVVFLVIAALMMTKKIPTLLALPLMAVIICIIAGVPADPGHHAERPGLYHYGWLHRAAYSGVGRRSGYQRSVHFPNGIHHGPHV